MGGGTGSHGIWGGATGTSGLLHAPITPTTVLGSPQSQFLHGVGVTATGPSGHQDPAGRSGAGLEQVVTELKDVLAGALPKSELTAIGGLANVLGPTGPHQGAAGGPHDTTGKPMGSVANLEEASKPNLNNLLPPRH
jgi:hypothetical protein